MSFKVSCTNCGVILHNGDFILLENVIQRFKSQCPNCKRKINPKIKMILINGKPLKLESNLKPKEKTEKWWRSEVKTES